MVEICGTKKGDPEPEKKSLNQTLQVLNNPIKKSNN
jgi:hypothetical protein